MLRSLASLSLLSLTSIAALAQHSQPTVPALDFLSGHWTSTSADTVEEEYWSPVIGKNMVGTFRVIKNGAPVFYEFWTIEVEDGTPIFKMKHFNPNLQGWEDKSENVRLPVVQSAPNLVVFSRADGTLSLRYERKGSVLLSTLHQVKAGKPHDELFTLHRVD